MEMHKPELKSMNLKELTAFVTEYGQKPFRAKQLFLWMHKKLAASVDEMTDISAAFRETIKNECVYTALKQENVQLSKADGTRKYLFRLDDGNLIESVFMRYKTGNSVCISSQAGCRMGCKFCASAINGLERNLLPSELLEQVYRISQDVNERISHVVVMGTGEPLDNYDNLLRFIELLCGEDGLHISQRNVTVSTCGIVPRILDLANENLSVTLALSLHAADQKKREELMPIAFRYGLFDILTACQYYFEKTGRRITFEYALFAGINDSMEDAAGLARLLSGKNCHVNLIPVNPVKERGFARPDRETVQAFYGCLQKSGINVTIRREMGSDIDAACGQLRKRYME